MSEPAPPPAPPPAAPASVRPRSPGVTLGVGQVIAVVGSIIVFVSIFINWVDFSQGRGTLTDTASGIPIQLLFNYTTRSHDPSIIPLLVVCAVLGILGAAFAARAPALRVLAILGGVLAIATALQYLFQIHQAIHAHLLPPRVGLTDFVGIAPWFAVAGGGAILLGAVIPAPRSGP